MAGESKVYISIIKEGITPLKTHRKGRTGEDANPTIQMQ